MEKHEPKWSGVKEQVSRLEHVDLVRLVGNLYRLDKANRDFLHARFANDERALGVYREIIDRCMYPDVSRDWTVKVAEALPSTIVTLAGTVASVVSSLARFTTRAPEVLPGRVTVPVAVPPWSRTIPT